MISPTPLAITYPAQSELSLFFALRTHESACSRIRLFLKRRQACQQSRHRTVSSPAKAAVLRSQKEEQSRSGNSNCSQVTVQWMSGYSASDHHNQPQVRSASQVPAHLQNSQGKEEGPRSESECCF